MAATSSSSSGAYASAEDIANLELVHQTFTRLRQQLKDKRILLKPFLIDFDRTQTGHITRDQFARSLSMLGLSLPKFGMEAFVRQFGSPRFPDQFNYRAFLAMLNQSDAAPGGTDPEAAAATAAATAAISPTRSTAAARTLSTSGRSIVSSGNTFGGTAGGVVTGGPVTYEQVLRKVQTRAQKQRIIVDQIFFDFDKLRTGRVSAAEFVRSMTMAGLYLTEPEMLALMAPFRLPALPNTIDYLGVQRAINSVLAGEPDPAVVATFKPWSPEEDNEVKAYSEDELRVRALVDRIAHLQYTRRIHLKPAFYDFDRAKNGCVTERQFKSLVSTYPLTISESDWALLIAYYRKGALGISYARFCDDVAAGERARSKEAPPAEGAAAAETKEVSAVSAATGRPPGPSPTASRGLYTPLPQQVVTAESVINRIRAEFDRNRADITDVFYDFDTLRKGHVSQSQFRRCLSMKNVQLTEAEHAVLLAAYSPYPSRVDYVSFCNAVYAVPNRRFGHVSPPLQLEPQTAAVPRPQSYVTSSAPPTAPYAEYPGGGEQPGGGGAASASITWL